MPESIKPLLMNGLTMPEKIMLAGLKRHVGFPVLVKLITALCEQSTADVIRLDPEKDVANYEKLLAIRQQRSRTTHDNARYLENSIEWHIQSAGQLATENLGNQLQLEGK